VDRFVDQVLVLNDQFWAWIIIPLLVLTSLVYLVLTRGIQFRLVPEMIRGLRESPGEDPDGRGRISAFQAFAVSSAARVGTGNIVGVSSAIAVGGPGAVFWMWVMATVVAATAFAESTLAQVYKERTGQGFKGGPAYYMKHGLGLPWMGVLFSVILILTYPVSFNMVQANTFTGAFTDSLGGFGVDAGTGAKVAVGLVLAAVTGVIVFGGLKRIARFSQLAVPFMAVIYLVIGVAVVAINADQIPEALRSIVTSAFGIEQFAGAGLGTVIIQGVRRGMFSNEGGMGSAPNAGAAAVVSHPAKQGLTQAFGVYFDTLFICTISAFIILTTSPVYGDTEVNLVSRGVEAALGGWALQAMALILMLFTFTSVLGNYYYGESSVRFLHDRPATINVLRGVVIAGTFTGSVLSLDTVWSLADVTMGLMATVNLVAVLALTGVVVKVLRDYDAQRRDGLDPVFHSGSVPGIKGLQVWEREATEPEQVWARGRGGTAPAATRPPAAVARLPVMNKQQEPWKSPIWRSDPAFLYSERPLARYVGRPAAEFLKIEPAAGIVLLLCAVAAMLWANSPWGGSYFALWGTDITVQVGDFTLSHTLQDWINDGLMAIFFFVVGMEIKSEIVSGELHNVRNALTPIAAAAGGMAVPALIYTAFNLGGEAARGWGVPMATDIAFALGILALFGNRIPSPARIFLLTLAIVDDLGAIAVIAVFYTDDLSMGWLAAAGGILVLAVALRLLNVWSAPVYIVVGLALWLAMLESGVHATIAGVLMGLIISAKPLLDPAVAHAEAQKMAEGGLTAAETERLVKLTRDAAPPAERIQERFHPFSSFVVLPLFALANAGVALGGDLLAAAVTSTVTIGIVLGLVVGKTVGITLATWIAVRLGIGRLPADAGWSLMIGIAAVAGIGFTVALFITELAFHGGPLADEAKIGVLAGSLIAAIAGAGLVALTAPGGARRREGRRPDA
jgi:NhaA family Na+:H+ antiporter